MPGGFYPRTASSGSSSLVILCRDLQNLDAVQRRVSTKRHGDLDDSIAGDPPGDGSPVGLVREEAIGAPQGGVERVERAVDSVLPD